MKKILLTAIVAIFAVGAVSAQENGRWGVGPKVGIYMNTGADGAIFGLGAAGRYRFADHWRVEPSIVALFKSGCSIDASGDVQYLFHVARFWDVYPQAGLSANDFGDWSLGISIGAGTDFAIARRWDLSAGFKYMIQTRNHSDNPIVVNIGATYKF